MSDKPDECWISDGKYSHWSATKPTDSAYTDWARYIRAGYPTCDKCRRDLEFCGNTGTAEFIGEIWKCVYCEIVPELRVQVASLTQERETTKRKLSEVETQAIADGRAITEADEIIASLRAEVARLENQIRSLGWQPQEAPLPTEPQS